MSGLATPIRASTVLPARREPVTLRTEDGLSLVGELATPLSQHPVATLVTLHPLPTHGGFMDSHLLRKAAWRLPALAGLAVLRFNTRGTSSPAGTSEGRFDEARGELLDVDAALRFVEERALPHCWLMAWSFGTDLALRHGPDPRVEGVVLLSPPLRYTTDADLRRWAGVDTPVVALVPELDDFLRPEEARRRFALIPQAEVVAVERGKHLWVGEGSVQRALDEVVARVVPGATPLPRVWDGPAEVATV